MRNTQTHLLILFTALSLWQCKTSQSKLSSSERGRALLLVEAQLVSKSRNENGWHFEIEKQLEFIQGQLSEAALSMDGLKADIGPVSDTDATSLRKVSYRAQIPVHLDSDELATTQTIFLPRTGDRDGRAEFSDHYQATCAAGEGDFAHTFRPYRAGCPLAKGIIKKHLVQKVEARYLSPNNRRQLAGYPEYGEIWADKKLNVTVIFPTDELTGSHERVFSQTLLRLSEDTGHLVTAEPKSYEWGTPYTFPVDKLGEIEVRFEYPSRIDQQDQQSRSLSTRSDIVHVIGNRSPSQLAELLQDYPFGKDRYTIIILSGIGTFAYPPLKLDLLFNKIHKEDSARYLDLIVDQARDHRGINSQALYATLAHLREGQKPYRDIIQDCDGSHITGVYYSENNAWPQAFRQGGFDLWGLWPF